MKTIFSLFIATACCINASESEIWVKSGKYKFGPMNERVRVEGKKTTTITITDQIKTEGLSSIGLNFGKGGSPNNPATKLRSTWSFEGVMFRSCAKVFEVEGNKLSLYQGSPFLEPVYGKGEVTILSGVHKGEKAKVKSVEFKKVFYKPWNKKIPVTEFVIDKEFPELNTINITDEKTAYYKKNKIKQPKSDGVLLENMDLQHLGRVPSGWWGKNISVEKENRPGGTGKLSGLLHAKGGQSAFIRMAGANNKVNKGEAKVRFWARSVEGSKTLKVKFVKGIYLEIDITNEWKQYTVKKALPDSTGFLVAISLEKEGKALLDEIEVFVGGDENPTPFRDHYIAVLKKLNVGIFRVLQMGGNTMENFIRPRAEQTRYMSSPLLMNKPETSYTFNDGPYSLHEVCELSEYLNIEPWVNIPGTLHEEEMDLLMEYLGGPAGTKGGDRRIALGQEKPWTETLSKIHIEYGNEQWNTFGPFLWGGYGGKDYWFGLTKRAKASKYFKKNMIFHAGSQNTSDVMAGNHAKNSSNMDRVTAAPYIMHGLSDKDDKLFREGKTSVFDYAFGYTLNMIANGMGKVDKALKKGKMEGMSIYEFNYHITGGDGPLYNRYRIAFTLGGAINIANSVLYMQKEFSAKEQCLFNFQQEYYKVGPKNNPGWGITLFDRNTKEYRYRPIALALDLMNRAIIKGGDSMQTLHEGECPTFESIGHYRSLKIKPKQLGKLTNIPTLWSYAFKKDGINSIALINLDQNKEHLVDLKFSGAAKNVQSWKLANDNIYSHNEWWDTPTSSFQNEWTQSFEKIKKDKKFKEKYTSEYLLSKETGIMAMEMLKDIWDYKGYKNIREGLLDRETNRWIKENAKGVASKEELFSLLEKKYSQKKKLANPFLYYTFFKETFRDFLKENSTPNPVQLKIEEAGINKLTDATKITIPKHSILVIKWEN